MMDLGTRAGRPAFVLVLGLALSTSVAPADTVWRDVSAEWLPMAVTNGKTMDAEFADLDGDLDMDLIIASEWGTNAVLLNLGRRFLFEPNAINSGRIHDSEDIGVGDFNRDGKLDLVFVSEDDQVNELYISIGGPGVVRFLDMSDQLPAKGVSNAVLTHDFNGDGADDLLFGNAGEPNEPGQQRVGGASEVWISAAGGRQMKFIEETGNRIPVDEQATQDFEMGDIDGDGDMDLLMAAENGNRIWLGDGLGSFADATEALMPEVDAVIETREIDLGDIDGDGDLDAILANVGWAPGANPRNRVWINDGSGAFTDESEARLPDAGQEFSLDGDLGDLDGDGDLDLVFGNAGHPLQPGSRVRVYLNDGTGVFTDATDAYVPELKFVSVIDVELVDLDGDGKLDLYIANHASSDRLLLSGRGR